ncbi:hypothetical protein BC777_3895 [Yoonia maricola]|uniref:DUF2169 domain-containing protein n=1 Tax=Yoonia maricola TaxID=420999 RepID=A0A2M8W0A2_9RHOB|nr:DUF2169 domain-containing protein [Yoonia maricola]PJI84353.1 hypothetical protein BC777_3895 [Yoonia maricola]
MWALKNKTPFAAGKAFDRDREGHEVLCLALRATLIARADGLWDLSESQTPVRLAPEMAGADLDELTADSDIVPFLAGAEITVSGTVRKDIPQDGSLAHIGVGNIAQDMQFWPARQARRVQDRVVVENLYEDRLPLTWSQSAGGQRDDGSLHPSNPVGCGFLTPAGSDPVMLPRVLAPQDQPNPLLDPQTHPVGCGPIHRHWAPRLTDAGTYDAAWQDQRAPLLPLDFKPDFYHAAPPGLRQAQAFQGNETLNLVGFGEGQNLSHKLPAIRAESFTDIGVDRIDVPLDLRRIDVDLDLGTVGLLWLAALPCDGQDHLIHSSTIYLRQVSGIAR